MLREVAVDGSKTYFDTNTADHHHFFVEDDNEVIDIPPGQMGVGRVPEPPPGYEISRVDVVVRLRRLNRQGDSASQLSGDVPRRGASRR